MSHNPVKSLLPLPDRVAEPSAPQRLVFLRDLILDAEIGVYGEEKGRTQPVCINLTMDVLEPVNPLADDPADVVCYNRITQSIEAILAEGHILLVETLAERIAALCLAHPMVSAVWVRVEKPQAIEQAAAAGVEIYRRKSTV